MFNLGAHLCASMIDVRIKTEWCDAKFRMNIIFVLNTYESLGMDILGPSILIRKFLFRSVSRPPFEMYVVKGDGNFFFYSDIVQNITMNCPQHDSKLLTVCETDFKLATG